MISFQLWKAVSWRCGTWTTRTPASTCAARWTNTTASTPPSPSGSKVSQYHIFIHNFSTAYDGVACDFCFWLCYSFTPQQTHTSLIVENNRLLLWYASVLILPMLRCLQTSTRRCGRSWVSAPRYSYSASSSSSTRSDAPRRWRKRMPRRRPIICEFIHSFHRQQLRLRHVHVHVLVYYVRVHVHVHVIILPY